MVFQCSGGKPNKTACMYGGVTLHENNQLYDTKKYLLIYGLIASELLFR